jgi:glycosyltransferase involved in cell wall biosynthesis
MTSIAYFNEGDSLYDSFFLKHLSKKFNVFLISFNPNPKYLVKGVDFIKLPMFMRRLPVHDSPRIYFTMPLRTLILKKALRNLKPDILVGCGGLDYGFCSALSGYKPFVLFIWGSEVLLAPKFLPFRAIVKYSLKKADLVFVDSEVQSKACIKLGCEKNKIIRFPWIDSQELEVLAENAKVERRRFREKFGWSEEDPVIICTRMHYKVYNIECIIDSIPKVLKHKKNARFIFVGSGPLTEKLRQLVHELNVEKNVYFAGFVPHEELFYYLKNSDVYVSSSLSDGTSASLLEAMICRLPCIVSKIPGNEEWIRDMDNGLLFPPKDSNSLAEKIVMLLEDERLSKSLGEKAFRTAHERANWNRNSKILYDLIEKFINYNL